MTNTDIAAQRLNSQHLAHPDFGSPAEVVRWFGAVQAQDYYGSLYAIGLRLPEATEKTIEKAVAEREIVRTWPMRGTIHYVPAEDVRWMLPLLAERRIPRNKNIYARVGLADADFEKARKVLVKALSGSKLLTRSEVYQALESARIKTGPEQRGLHIVAYWAQKGLICLGARRGRQTTVSLLDDWIPGGRALKVEEALAELARRYFVSHGPATLADFAWWSGLSAAEARRGLQAIRAHLTPLTVEGRTYWSGPMADPPRANGAVMHLLPAYDEFAVAYKDRRDLVAPELGKEIGYGLGPSIISDGRLIGRWKRTLDKDKAVIELDLLAKADKKQNAGLQKAAERYGRFLDLPVEIAS